MQPCLEPIEGIYLLPLPHLIALGCCFVDMHGGFKNSAEAVPTLIQLGTRREMEKSRVMVGYVWPLASTGSLVTPHGQQGVLRPGALVEAIEIDGDRRDVSTVAEMWDALGRKKKFKRLEILVRGDKRFPVTFEQVKELEKAAAANDPEHYRSHISF